MNRRAFLGIVAGAGALTVLGTQSAQAVTHTKWNRPTVYVLDKLGSAWPVQLAAEAWDDSSALDLVRVTKLPTLACSYITVETGNLPAGVLGQAFTERDGLGRYKRARVVINASIRMAEFDQGRRLALVRHEIGHCLGFNHSRTGRDVMLEKILKGGPTGLSEFHTTTLKEVYG